MNVDRLVKSFRHSFKGYHNCHSECQVDVYQYNDKYAVVFTELGIGTSVTNASEQLATEMLSLLGLDPFDTLWAERYNPEKGVRFVATLDQVTYQWTGTKYAAPEWKRVESVKQMIETYEAEVNKIKTLIMNDFKEPNASDEKISPLGWYGDQPGVLYVAATDNPKKYLVRGASEINWESMWLDTIKIGVGSLPFTPNPSADKLHVDNYLQAISAVKVGPMLISGINSTKNHDPDRNGLLLNESSPFVDSYSDDLSEQSHQRYVERTQKEFQSRMKM